MTTRSVTTTGLHLFAACSLALLVAAGGGAALARGGGGDHGGGRFGNSGDDFSSKVHSRCIDCGGTHLGRRNIDGNYWRHHHHHHGTGPGGLGKVHGPGSSHNPIIAPATVVRDHRLHSHSPVIPPGSVVRDHRRYHPTPHHGCRDGYWKNCAWGNVRDHRS